MSITKCFKKGIKKTSFKLLKQLIGFDINKLCAILQNKVKKIYINKKINRTSLNDYFILNLFFYLKQFSQQ